MKLQTQGAAASAHEPSYIDDLQLSDQEWVVQFLTLSEELLTNLKAKPSPENVEEVLKAITTSLSRLSYDKAIVLANVKLISQLSIAVKTNPELRNFTEIANFYRVYIELVRSFNSINVIYADLITKSFNHADYVSLLEEFSKKKVVANVNQLEQIAERIVDQNHSIQSIENLVVIVQKLGNLSFHLINKLHKRDIAINQPETSISMEFQKILDSVSRMFVHKANPQRQSMIEDKVHGYLVDVNARISQDSKVVAACVSLFVSYSNYILRFYDQHLNNLEITENINKLLDTVNSYIENFYLDNPKGLIAGQKVAVITQRIAVFKEYIMTELFGDLIGQIVAKGYLSEDARSKDIDVSELLPIIRKLEEYVNDFGEYTNFSNEFINADLERLVDFIKRQHNDQAKLAMRRIMVTEELWQWCYQLLILSKQDKFSQKNLQTIESLHERVSYCYHDHDQLVNIKRVLNLIGSYGFAILQKIPSLEEKDGDQDSTKWIKAKKALLAYQQNIFSQFAINSIEDFSAVYQEKKRVFGNVFNVQKVNDHEYYLRFSDQTMYKVDHIRLLESYSLELSAQENILSILEETGEVEESSKVRSYAIRRFYSEGKVILNAFRDFVSDRKIVYLRGSIYSNLLKVTNYALAVSNELKSESVQRTMEKQEKQKVITAAVTTIVDGAFAEITRIETQRKEAEAQQARLELERMLESEETTKAKKLAAKQASEAQRRYRKQEKTEREAAKRASKQEVQEKAKREAAERDAQLTARLLAEKRAKQSEEEERRAAQLVAQREEEERRAAKLVAQREEEERRVAQLAAQREEEERRAAQLVAQREEEERRAAQLAAQREEEEVELKHAEEVSVVSPTTSQETPQQIVSAGGEIEQYQRYATMYAHRARHAEVYARQLEEHSRRTAVALAQERAKGIHLQQILFSMQQQLFQPRWTSMLDTRPVETRILSLAELCRETRIAYHPLMENPPSLRNYDFETTRLVLSNINFLYLMLNRNQTAQLSDALSSIRQLFTNLYQEFCDFYQEEFAINCSRINVTQVRQLGLKYDYEKLQLGCRNAAKIVSALGVEQDVFARNPLLQFTELKLPDIKKMPIKDIGEAFSVLSKALAKIDRVDPQNADIIGVIEYRQSFIRRVMFHHYINDLGVNNFAISLTTDQVQNVVNMHRSTKQANRTELFDDLLDFYKKIDLSAYDPDVLRTKVCGALDVLVQYYHLNARNPVPGLSEVISTKYWQIKTAVILQRGYDICPSGGIADLPLPRRNIFDRSIAITQDHARSSWARELEEQRRTVPHREMAKPYS